MERKKVILIIIVAVVIVALGVAAYYIYQADRMSKMDKIMLDSNNNIATPLNNTVVDANKIANKTPTNYTKLEDTLTQAINYQEKGISNDEEAYKYADGDYKELLNLALIKDRIALSILNSWYTRVTYYQEGNYVMANNMFTQETTLATDYEKANNDYVNFKSTHPEVKEHTIKYWNSTNV